MINDCDHRLRLKRAALERIHDSLLHLDDRTSLRPNGARIGNADVPFIVDCLVRKGDEISWTDAGLKRNEQAPRAGLEHRHADDISDAEANFTGPTPVRKHLRDSWRFTFKDFLERPK